MASSRYYKKRRRSFRSRLRRFFKNPQKRFLFFGALAVVVIAAVLFLVLLRPRQEVTYNQKYLASSSVNVPYYVYNDEEHRLIRSSNSLKRGAQVTDLNRNYSENGTEYAVIEYNDDTYYINRSAMVDSPEDVIQEKEVWVRTSATVYKNETGFEIASLAKKGDRLEVLDYDRIQPDGTIGKYKIRFTDITGADITGWVYGKYMVATKEEAEAVNTEVYEAHKNRIYPGLELYGGYPTTLDWYPVEKPSFPDNPLCEVASAMYITVQGTAQIDEYIKIAKENGVNAVVINIKDGGQIGYICDEIRDISPTTNKYSMYADPEDYKKAVQKCKDAGLYCIGRIVAFNDELYALDHPEDCIYSPAASQNWPSGYSRDCWYFNLLIAKSAIELCGFNEIQFDYLRFPEESYSMSNNPETDFRNLYDEEKAEAIQNFCYYASDVLHEMGVYMSVDVFGECANKYVTAYGQYYPAIALVVDAISAMPYTDHFGREEDTWSVPYPTIYDWGLKAAARQSETPNPAIARTWVTAYDVPYWNMSVECDAKYVADQAQALVDAGLYGGFITWNGYARLDKYTQIADAWNHTYVPGVPRVN